MKVIITEDTNCEMLKIETEYGKELFYGNYWDFNRCGKSFKEMFKTLGHKVDLVKKDYDDWYE